MTLLLLVALTALLRRYMSHQTHETLLHFDLNKTNYKFFKIDPYKKSAILSTETDILDVYKLSNQTTVTQLRLDHSSESENIPHSHKIVQMRAMRNKAFFNSSYILILQSGHNDIDILYQTPKTQHKYQFFSRIGPFSEEIEMFRIKSENIFLLLKSKKIIKYKLEWDKVTPEDPIKLKDTIETQITEDISDFVIQSGGKRILVLTPIALYSAPHKSKSSTSFLFKTPTPSPNRVAYLKIRNQISLTKLHSDRPEKVYLYKSLSNQNQLLGDFTPQTDAISLISVAKFGAFFLTTRTSIVFFHFDETPGASVPLYKLEIFRMDHERILDVDLVVAYKSVFFLDDQFQVHGVVFCNPNHYLNCQKEQGSPMIFGCPPNGGKQFFDDENLKCEKCDISCLECLGTNSSSCSRCQNTSQQMIFGSQELRGEKIGQCCNVTKGWYITKDGSCEACWGTCNVCLQNEVHKHGTPHSQCYDTLLEEIRQAAELRSRCFETKAFSASKEYCREQGVSLLAPRIKSNDFSGLVLSISLLPLKEMTPLIVGLLTNETHLEDKINVEIESLTLEEDYTKEVTFSEKKEVILLTFRFKRNFGRVILRLNPAFFMFFKSFDDLWEIAAKNSTEFTSKNKNWLEGNRTQVDEVVDLLNIKLARTVHELEIPVIKTLEIGINEKTFYRRFGRSLSHITTAANVVMVSTLLSLSCLQISSQRYVVLYLMLANQCLTLFSHSHKGYILKSVFHGYYGDNTRNQFSLRIKTRNSLQHPSGELHHYLYLDWRIWAYKIPLFVLTLMREVFKIKLLGPRLSCAFGQLSYFLVVMMASKSYQIGLRVIKVVDLRTALTDSEATILLIVQLTELIMSQAILANFALKWRKMNKFVKNGRKLTFRFVYWARCGLMLGLSNKDPPKLAKIKPIMRRGAQEKEKAKPRIRIHPTNSESSSRRLKIRRKLEVDSREVVISKTRKLEKGGSEDIICVKKEQKLIYSISRSRDSGSEEEKPQEKDRDDSFSLGSFKKKTLNEYSVDEASNYSTEFKDLFQHGEAPPDSEHRLINEREGSRRKKSHIERLNSLTSHRMSGIENAALIPISRSKNSSPSIQLRSMGNDQKMLSFNSIHEIGNNSGSKEDGLPRLNSGLSSQSIRDYFNEPSLIESARLIRKRKSIFSRNGFSSHLAQLVQDQQRGIGKGGLDQSVIQSVGSVQGEVLTSSPANDTPESPPVSRPPTPILVERRTFQTLEEIKEDQQEFDISKIDSSVREGILPRLDSKKLIRKDLGGKEEVDAGSRDSRTSKKQLGSGGSKKLTKNLLEIPSISISPIESGILDRSIVEMNRMRIEKRLMQEKRFKTNRELAKLFEKEKHLENMMHLKLVVLDPLKLKTGLPESVLHAFDKILVLDFALKVISSIFGIVLFQVPFCVLILLTVHRAYHRQDVCLDPPAKYILSGVYFGQLMGCVALSYYEFMTYLHLVDAVYFVREVEIFYVVFGCSCTMLMVFYIVYKVFWMLEKRYELMKNLKGYRRMKIA